MAWGYLSLNLTSLERHPIPLVSVAGFIPAAREARGLCRQVSTIVLPKVYTTEQIFTFYLYITIT